MSLYILSWHKTYKVSDWSLLAMSENTRVLKSRIKDKFVSISEPGWQEAIFFMQMWMWNIDIYETIESSSVEQLHADQ